MNPYYVVWRFVVDPACRAEFEAAYSEEGRWAVFFSQGAGYLGTELFCGPDDSPTYVTIDRWISREAYEQFRRTHAAEYGEIDRRCAELTIKEEFLSNATETHC